MSAEPIAFVKVGVIRYIDADDGDRVIFEQKCPLEGVALVEKVIVDCGYVYCVGFSEVTNRNPGVMFVSCRKVSIYEEIDA